MNVSWRTAKLGDISDLITKGTTPTSVGYDFVSEGINFVKVESIKENGEFRKSKFAYITDKCNESLKRSQLKEGDILISIAGAIGRTALVSKDILPANTNQALALIRLKESPDFTTEYVYKTLSTLVVLDQIEKFRGGMAQQNLSLGQIKMLEIPIPSIEEQKCIVAILDEAFAGIDTAIANTQKNLANARELFESYLNSAFNNADGGWPEKNLKDVCIEFGRGKSKHRPRNDPKLYGGDYPFIQTGDVRNCNHKITAYSQTYNETGLSQSKLWPKGTICITIAANIAETGILDFDACFPDSIIGMVVDENQTSNTYIEYLLQSVKARIQAKGKGSAQDNINLATFENELFPFPEKEVQKEIVERLEYISSYMQTLEEIYQRKLNSLNELKQSLLQKAFSGELTTNNVVPITSTVKSLAAGSPEFAAHVMAAVYHWHESQGRNKTFGRVKAQKTLHLVEALAGIDMGRNPIKDAAGPNDSRHMRAAEDWSKAQGFFEFVQRADGRGYDFKKLRHYDDLIGKSLEQLEPYKIALHKVVELTLSLNTENAEILTTVYAAWNNLLLDGMEPTEEAIIHEARDNWHPDKTRFTKSRFRQAIQTIRSNGIVPTGSGRRVVGQENMF